MFHAHVSRIVRTALACVAVGTAYGALAGATYGVLFLLIPGFGFRGGTVDSYLLFVMYALDLGGTYGFLLGGMGGLVTGLVGGCAVLLFGTRIGGIAGWGLAGVSGGCLAQILLHRLLADPVNAHPFDDPSEWLPAIIGGGIGLVIGFALRRARSGLPGIKWLIEALQPVPSAQ